MQHLCQDSFRKKLIVIINKKKLLYKEYTESWKFWFSICRLL